MAGSRLKSKYLSNTDVAGGPLAPHSHKRSAIWRFLQSVKPGHDETGDVLRLMRERRDMVGKWATITQMRRYMSVNCKLDSATVTRVYPHVWSLWREWLGQMGVVGSQQPSTLAPGDLQKSGISQDDLALAILQGLGIFEHPEQNLREGGKWADSARSAATAVIELVYSTLHARRPQELVG